MIFATFSCVNPFSLILALNLFAFTIYPPSISLHIWDNSNATTLQ